METHQIPSSNDHILDRTSERTIPNPSSLFPPFFSFWGTHLHPSTSRSSSIKLILIHTLPSTSLVETIKGPLRNGTSRSPRPNGYGPTVCLGLGHGMMTCGGINGGGRNSHPLARWAHSECGGWGHLHVKLRGKFECSKLLNFLLQPSIFLRQILATPFQHLAIHLSLLQFSPEINFTRNTFNKK